MSALQSWAEAACAELDIDPASVDAKTVLELARVAAHQVERPAAPLTTFMLGVAVGQGQRLEAASNALRQLAGRWDPAAASSPPAP